MIEFNKKELTIKKPSAMIQTNVKELTLIQRKIINFLIHIVQNQGEQKYYSACLADIKKACGISSKSNDELKENIKKLTKITIEFNIFEKDSEEWEINVLLAGAKVEFNSGIVEFAFSHFIQERIVKPLIYSPLKLLTIASFTSSYSVILYEFLRDYLDSPQVPKLTIQQLKDLLGMEHDKYPEFKYFKRDILQKTIREINKKSEITCGFKLIKEFGNRYAFIQFFVKRKPESKPIEEISRIIKIAEHDDELFCKKVSDSLKIRLDKVFELLLKHGKDKMKDVYKYTQEKSKSNPGGFFLKALEEGYSIPVGETLNLFQHDGSNGLTAEANKCYNAGGHYGNCGSTWKTALSEKSFKACFWCPKYKIEREELRQTSDSSVSN